MFTVSAKTQYAIRAMTCLAKMEGRNATSLEIAQAENIPAKYLEGIMRRLKVAGLVESERGKKGGYRMVLDPSSIKMLDIVEAIEGRIKPVTCVDKAELCSLGAACLPRRFWVGLKAAIDGYLAEHTLKDVAEG
ncbi:Rrf2 family transcriptional regulator [Spirochaetota bacterium]